MTDAVESRRRHIMMRVGLALLSLFTGDLALMRISRWKAGLSVLFGPAVVSILSVIAAVSPTITPGFYLGLIIVLIGASILLLLFAIALTWKASALRERPLRWWQTWYGLLLAYVVGFLVQYVAVEGSRWVYKPYYAPSESMEPTIPLGDNFLAQMSDRSEPRRGEVLVVTVGRSAYVKRVAAIAGDRIAMKHGVPIINGVASTQMQTGTYQTSQGVAARFSERLPGEAGTHDVIDTGKTSLDEMPEIIVPTGHFFALGDWRDNSADSRVPKVEGGMDLPSNSDILGRVLFRTFDQN